MNDPDQQLNQWLAYRQEKTAALDIRQAIQRELTSSPFSVNSPAPDSQTFRFPITRIAFSSLTRISIGIIWFFAST